MSKTFTTRLETGTVTILQNLIIWHDGTIRPKRGHNQCSGHWDYDGQFFVHKDNSSPVAPSEPSRGKDNES